MNQEFKVIVSVILTVWLFAIGMIVGQYSRRNSPATEPQTEQTESVAEPSAVGTTDSATAYVTNEQGAVYVDENGQPVTQVLLPALPEGTVYMTDPNGAVYVDEAGQPMTSSAPTSQPVTAETSTDAPTDPLQTQTTSPVSSDAKIDARKTADALAIKSNHFYVEGRQFSSADQTELPMKFATDENGVEIFTQLEGIELGMMLIDGEMFIVFNDGYLKLSKTLMKMIDIDPSEFQFDSSFLTSLFDDTADATVETVKEDGEKLTRTEYDGSRGHMKVYSKGNELLRAEIFANADDEKASEIYYFDEVTAEIPPKMLNTDQLEKKSMISFFTEFMQAAGEEIDMDDVDLSELQKYDF